jgi:hypothetical protein
MELWRPTFDTRKDFLHLISLGLPGESQLPDGATLDLKQPAETSVHRVANVVRSSIQRCRNGGVGLSRTITITIT